MPVSSLVFDTLREPVIPRVQQVAPTVTSTAPQVVPMAPPAPARPQVLGRYEENGKAAVFISAGGREYVVREGDRIEDQYEVKRVDPDSVVLLYLPQNELQTFATGER
ncbi:hypothetical protein JI745_17910 [Piscinibacter sp. HJYY11]|nr:hypothetical protein [Piscinibacter sp. HJYY11]